MMRIVCHERAHAARGSNFLLLRQKKVTKRRRPRHSPRAWHCEIWSENVARSETRYAQTTDRFIDVFTPNLGGERTGTPRTNT